MKISILIERILDGMMAGWHYGRILDTPYQSTFKLTIKITSSNKFIIPF